MRQNALYSRSARFCIANGHKNTNMKKYRLNWDQVQEIVGKLGLALMVVGLFLGIFEQAGLTTILGWVITGLVLSILSCLQRESHD